MQGNRRSGNQRLRSPLRGPGVDLDRQLVAPLTSMAVAKISAGVFLGQLVDEVERFIEREVDHLTADFEVALRVRRVQERDGDMGIAPQIAVFLRLFLDTHQDVLAVPEKPDAVHYTMSTSAIRSQARYREYPQKIARVG